MRKDYVEPDDYEWEPTPHGDVLGEGEGSTIPGRRRPLGRGGGRKP
jgi:hypothetical protein